MPQTETANIIGHKILLGTNVILAKILAPKKPNIKKSTLAINIAPKIPYKNSGCSLNKSGPGLGLTITDKYKSDFNIIE